jgi:ABC-type multidrug transport system ATPase subunit
VNAPADSTTALRFEGIRKRYGSIQALDGLSLEVPRGSIFGLVGPNGAGKTTAFAIMCGFLRPDSGAVSILGEGRFNPRHHRGRITALPQDAALGRDLTVVDLLSYLGRLQGIPRGQIRTEVERILKLVDLTDRAKSRAKTLSHGMLRRLGIGQAFLGNPEIVLLDEPTNGLDPRQAHEIRQFIAAQRGARAIIVSSHNLHEIETICDRLALIDHGRLVMGGIMSEITGQNEEICIALGDGPIPLMQLQAALPGDVVEWDEAARALKIRFAAKPNRQAEDVISAALRTLLDAGARISAVSRGQSLERAFLDLPAGSAKLPPKISSN